ncbi:MAG TPA: hypothetical protein VHD69_01085 [Candidatus Paceibacterota bacterium]|nr:hypothetical protein [Candidatus Paceibacterota bacterium]
MTQYVQEKVERLEHPVTAWALLGIIIALVLTYACFINMTIANIVATRATQATIAALTSSVSGLESTYLAAKATVTMDEALAQGFKASSGDPVYISKADGGSLSFNR